MDTSLAQEVLPDKGINPGSESVSQAKEAIEKNRADAGKPKRKRGRPSNAEKEEKRLEQMEDVSKAINEMFKPEHWEAIIRAPADMALAITGDPVFEMPTEQVKGLSASGSICARHFLQTDPKWLALTLFSINALTVYGGMTLAHLNNKKKEQAE